MEPFSYALNPFQEQIKSLVRQGGPAVKDYQYVDNLTIQLSHQIRSGYMTHDERMAIRSEFGVSLSNASMQGFMFNKSHGYAGDYAGVQKKRWKG